MNELEKKFRLDLDESAQLFIDYNNAEYFRKGAHWAFQWFSRQPKLFQLMAFSDRYQINFQMWPNQYTIFIEKNDVELWSYGSSDASKVIDKALEYLNRITRTTTQ